MTVIDCTKDAGWPKDLPIEAVMELIALSDIWPRDVLLVRLEGEICTMHYIGTNEWVVKYANGTEAGRVTPKKSNKRTK